jgi:hypothetical protein
MSFPVDLYTGVHKGQRYYLSRLSKQAGSLDVNNLEALDHLKSEFSHLREEFILHAALEEEHIHPLLYERIPEGARDLEEDHIRQRENLEALGNCLEVLSEKPMEFEPRGELALEFYRGLNRFIASYLVHVDKEEEVIQPMLWRICTEKELASTYNTILSSMEPEELMMNLEIMIPAMNIYERSMILSNAKKMGPEIFNQISSLAERVLIPEDWMELKKRIEE